VTPCHRRHPLSKGLRGTYTRAFRLTDPTRRCRTGRRPRPAGLESTREGDGGRSRASDRMPRCTAGFLARRLLRFALGPTPRAWPVARGMRRRTTSSRSRTTIQERQPQRFGHLRTAARCRAAEYELSPSPHRLTTSLCCTSSVKLLLVRSNTYSLSGGIELTKVCPSAIHPRRTTRFGRNSTWSMRTKLCRDSGRKH
jgi:hypothetical protein